MRKSKGVAAAPRKCLHSFTLIELLVVMLIISILAALSVAAGFKVFEMGKRSRARTEIQAMSAAMEGYKVDNGIYPQGDGNLTTNGSSSGTFYTADDGTTPAPAGEYQTNSTLLYMALSGQTNYDTAPAVGTKAYMQFRVNQVANQAAGGYSYIHDPWNAAYGYSTGTSPNAANTNYPYGGSGLFDLWSDAGVTLGQYGNNHSLTNAWICTWTQ